MSYAQRFQTVRIEVLHGQCNADLAGIGRIAGIESRDGAGNRISVLPDLYRVMGRLD